MKSRIGISKENQLLYRYRTNIKGKDDFLKNLNLKLWLSSLFTLGLVIACKPAEFKDPRQVKNNTRDKAYEDPCRGNPNCYNTPGQQNPGQNPSQTQPGSYGDYGSVPPYDGGSGGYGGKGSSSAPGIVDGIIDVIGGIWGSKGDSPGKGSSSDPSEPDRDPYPDPETPSKGTPAPAVNACDMAVNKSINVGGYSFNMTDVTYEAFGTVGSSGIIGNQAAVFSGQLKPVLNSFTYHVRGGRTHNSGSYSLTRALVVVNGYDQPFARISNTNYSISGRNYDVRYDLRAAGACLARYGSYSGGNAILVVP